MRTDTFPITVPLPPFYQDHHTNGRPVLPAVEAMELLAADARRRFPQKKASRRLTDVRFEKFLYLDAPESPSAFHRVAHNENGSLRSDLTSRFQAPRVKISRTLEHASLILEETLPPMAVPPLDMTASLAGICTVVEPKQIYAQMVPFGPAYRNIRHKLLISPDGAMAPVGSPQPRDPRRNLYLGSPYVLDAAFQAACVWCQRYCERVTFPVSLDQRTVLRPTRPDRIYTARVVPRQTKREPFVFDIFIYDENGKPCEGVSGIRMRDVSGGRNRPPQGFFQPEGVDSLPALSNRVSGLVLLERGALAPFAAEALSDGEKKRLGAMTAKRAKGYLSARLALKRLSRQLSGNDDRRKPWEIETVAQDGQRPQCPLADGRLLPCSVTHDRRFTLAVAADVSVGVDAEPLAEKPLAAANVFMDNEEQAVVRQAKLDDVNAALRAWSAKESAAKALGIDLAAAWERTRLIAISETESLLELEGIRRLKAVHASVQGHLFTLLTVDGSP